MRTRTLTVGLLLAFVGVVVLSWTWTVARVPGVGSGVLGGLLPGLAGFVAMVGAVMIGLALVMTLVGRELPWHVPTTVLLAGLLTGVVGVIVELAMLSSLLGTAMIRLSLIIFNLALVLRVMGAVAIGCWIAGRLEPRRTHPGTTA